MGFKGSTGERTTTATNQDERPHGRRHRRRPQSVARPIGAAAVGPERLESRLMFAAASAVPVVSLVWSGQTASAKQGQYLVQTGNIAKFQTLAARDGFTGVTSLRGGGFYQFTSTWSVADMQALSKRTKQGFSTLQPNFTLKLDDVTTPTPVTTVNDPLFPQQWALNNTGQLESYDYNNDGLVTPYDAQEFPSGQPVGGGSFPSPPAANENQYGITGDDIHVQQAWTVTEGIKSVVVADLDTGMDVNHPDIIPNLFNNPLDTAANGYNGDGYPGDIHGYNLGDNNDDLTDIVGHGTNTGGIIAAAGDNGQGVSGVAPNITLLPVKVADAAGNLSDAAIIGGVNYCINLKDHGINIVAMNESLGGVGFPIDVLEGESIAQAGKAGILDVVAAGNDGSNLDRTPGYPAKYSNALSNVITVAAVDNQFKIADFSDFGADTVDLGSPGINILGLEPLTPGFIDQTALNTAYDIPPETPVYGFESGTSQATPQVAGIIGLEASANPQATMAQLKQALLKGVTYDPNLAAQNGQAPLVRTSGVANAYGAVEAVLNPFAGTNVTRGGSWVGYYGSQGSYVIGDATPATSSIGSVTLDGGSPVVVSNDSHSAAATQRASDPTGRVSAYQGSATTETINLTFTDGQAHQTSLYLLDPDRQHRVETVSVIDPVTGRTIDAETVSNFSKGQYLTWDLRGSIDLVIDGSTGGDHGGAAYSGLFFDAQPAAPITYQGTDATTTGANWRNTYGSQGSFIAGDNNTGTVPAYVSGFDITGGTPTVLANATLNVHGLQKTYDLRHNIESYYSTTTSMDVDADLTDGLAHTVTLYLADYGNKRRAERVQVIDVTTGAVLVTQDVSNFSKGQFVSFRVSGDVDFHISGTAGPNAVLSGVFFDATFGSNAYFNGTTTGLGGNWANGPFGATAAYVVGDNFPGLDVPAGNAQVSIVGASRGVIAVPTNDKRALLKTEPTSGSTRVEAYAYTTSSMTIDYNPGDYVQHQLTLYFADYENFHRAESVTLYNATTNTVLEHQVISNFRGGKYLSYDVTGPILITINNGTFPNAVLSGLFID